MSEDTTVERQDNRKKSAKNDATMDQFGKPMLRVKFLNNDDPDLDLAFSYQPAGGQMEKYHLFPGYEYELPRHIVEYLNNQAYPVYQTQVDEKSGQVFHQHVGNRNRFTCHPLSY
jgi:hypothetical protein